MKYTHFLVEYYDQVSGRWGERMFTNQKQAQGYMDGVSELLRASGDSQPIVGMQFLTVATSGQRRQRHERA
jgi:hypothetical protein